MKLRILAALAVLAQPAAAIAQDDRPVWWLHIEDGEATLGYSIPDSDDGGPTLQCDRPGAGETPGKVRVGLLLERRLRGATTSLQIRAGAVIGNYPAKATPEEMYGGTELDAVVPLASPVITEFARTGRIRFTAAGEVVNPAIAPAAKVAALMRFCRGR